MSGNRSVFLLGDGVDSLTGAHKGRGIISYNPSEMKSNQVTSGETQYNVVLINNYSDLYNALDLNVSLTAPINPSNSISTEASLFKSAQLSSQTVSLLVKGKGIDYVQMMPHDARVDQSYVDAMKNNPASFIQSHGDEYVSQVMYGKKIYALINFKNTSKEDVIQYKQTLEANLQGNINGQANGNYSSKSNVQNTVSNINLEYAGVTLQPPAVTSSVDDLFTFINTFNKTQSNGCPMGFVSEPYATIMFSPESAALYDQSVVVKSIISKCDQLYNQTRFLLPTLIMLYNGVTYYQQQKSNPDLFAQIKQLLSSANQYQGLLEAVMLEISINRFDLTSIPDKIVNQLKLKIPSKTVEAKSMQSFNVNQFSIYNQLNTFVQKYTDLIQTIELSANEISRKLIAQISKVSSVNEKFSLNLPAGGASVRWDIVPSTSASTDHFDLVMATPGKVFKSWTSDTMLFRNIVNGMEIKMNVQPSDQLKIKTDTNENISVVASVCGLTAFDPLLPRAKTEWIADAKQAPVIASSKAFSLQKNSIFKNNQPGVINKNSIEYKKMESVSQERKAALDKKASSTSLSLNAMSLKN